MGISRGTVEEAIKSLQIAPSVVAKWSHIGYHLVFGIGSLPTGWKCTPAKTARLKIDYMGIRKTQITLHGVPLDVMENHLGAFFMTYAKVASVSQFSANQALRLVLEVTVTR